MDYSLSGIKMNVYIGNQDRAKEELAKLIKNLESNTIKIKVDFEDIKSQLNTVTKVYEQSGKSQASAVEKTQSVIKNIYKSSNTEIKSMVEQQRKMLESQYGNRGKVNYTYTTDQFGNSNITGAFIEIKNQAQETEKVIFGLRKSIQTVGNEIHKIYQFDTTGKKQILDLKQTDKDLDKFGNKVANTRKKYETELQKILNKNKDLASDKGIIEFTNRLNNLDNVSLDKLQQELTDLRLSFAQMKAGFQETGMLSQASDNLFKRVGQYFASTAIYYKFAQAVRFGVSSIIELDTAMIELSKTSNASDQELKSYIKTANKSAIDLATSTKDLITATADFSRVGYTNLKDADELAKIATIYKNVGDDMTIEDASSSMIATMQAFKIEAKDALEIVDKFNIVSNNFAISSKGIGEALTSSANALFGANNTLEESISLITAANITAQDPARVGNAMKSISMKLRSINDETGELIPKFRELILLQTDNKIDIMADEDTYKSTYQIIKELSSVWGELSDKQAAFLSKELAGVHRGDVFMGLMESAKTLDKALETAMNSSGSAMAENAKYVQSLNARINELRENAVLLWQTVIDKGDMGNLITFAADMIRGLTDIIDKCGGITPILSSILGLLIAIKSVSIANGLISAGDNIANITKSMISLGSGLKTTVAGMTSMQTALTGLTGGIGVAMIAISGLVVLQNKHKQEQEDLARVNRELADTYANEVNGIKEVVTQYSNIYNSTDSTVNKKEELSKLQDKLISDYKLEKGAIDLLNGSYETQVELLQGIISGKANASNVLLKDARMDLINQMGDITGNLAGKDWLGFNKAFSFDSDTHKEDFERIAKSINEGLGNEIIKISKDGEVFDKYFVGLFGDPEYRLKALELLIVELDKSSLSQSGFADSVKLAYDSVFQLVDQYREYQEQEQKNNMSMLMSKQGIWDITNATKEQVLALQEAYVAEQVLTNGEAYAAQAQNEFRNAIYGTNEAFDKYVDNIGDVESATGVVITQQERFAKTIKELNKQFDDATSKAKDLDSVLEDINDGRGIRADSVKKLTSDYPELLKYIDDEASLKQAVINKIKEQEQIQEDSINYIRALQSETFTQMESELSSYYSNLGVAYSQDFERYKTMEEAKAKISKELINSLSNAWAEYFGMISNSLGSNIDHISDMSSDDYNSLTDSEKAQMKALEDKQRKIKTDVDSIFEKYKLDPIDIKLDGSYGNKKSNNAKDKKEKSSKAEYEKYYSQLIDEKINIILSENKRLEEAIAFTEEKLTHAQLMGDKAQQEVLQNDLIEYAKKKRDLTASTAEELRKIGNDARLQLNSMSISGYEGFNFSNLNEMDIAKINQAFDRSMTGINDKTKASIELQKSKFGELSTIITRIYGNELPGLSKDWWDSTNQLIQNQIDLLELKKEILSEPLSDMELEISQHENKIKLLELENATMEDQVSVYNSLLDSETLREEYLKLTIDDLYKQRDLLDSTSKQYKTLTQYILDFESQLTDSLQSQANAKEKLIDMTYKELEASLETSIYGNRGQKEWEKLNNKRIARLNDELDLLKKQATEKQKQADAEKRALEMAELRTKLENAKKQKTVQEFVKDKKTGQWQWKYVADAGLISDLEKQIRDKQLEEEKRVEDEKQAKKEQDLRDEISRLQKESKAKNEFFNQSKEDLLQYLKDNKDSLTINGEEILGIVANNMDDINDEFDTKMKLIGDSLRDKLSEIKAMFQDALSMESSMGSMGGGGSSSSGGKTYSNTGASGKVYFQQPDGSIIVDRPNGTSSTVKPSDKTYSSTVSAMEKDKVNKKYKEGGTTDKTGWHWLDGEPGVPERVLSARQTAAFELGMENIPRFNFEIARMLGRMEEVTPTSRMSNAVVNNSSTPTLHIDKIEMHEVNNVKDMARAIRDELPNAFAGLITKSKLVPSGE